MKLQVELLKEQVELLKDRMTEKERVFESLLAENDLVAAKTNEIYWVGKTGSSFAAREY